jgi:hypothetical protein
VSPEKTADPAAFTEAIDVVRNNFQLAAGAAITVPGVTIEDVPALRRGLSSSDHPHSPFVSIRKMSCYDDHWRR